MKEERIKEILNLNMIVPNGWLIALEVSDYIQKQYGGNWWLSDQFTNDIAGKINEIANRVISGDYPDACDVPVFCWTYFIFDDDILNVEVYWHDDWREMYKSDRPLKKNSGWLHIPVSHTGCNVSYEDVMDDFIRKTGCCLPDYVD